jgi:hypothetical protein
VQSKSLSEFKFIEEINSVYGDSKIGRAILIVMRYILRLPDCGAIRAPLRRSHLLIHINACLRGSGVCFASPHRDVHGASRLRSRTRPHELSASDAAGRGGFALVSCATSDREL